MAGELVTAITPLGGVVLGGTLSYLVQHSTQRMSVRAEQRRQDLARALRGARRPARRVPHRGPFRPHLTAPVGLSTGSGGVTA